MKQVFHSSTSWAFLAAIALALLLPGCASAPQDTTLNRMQIRTVAAAHTVYFAPGSAALAPVEQARLETFLGQGRVTRVNAVTIGAGSSPIAAQRDATVSAALNAMGYSHVVAPPNPDFTADAVLVSVTRETAVPPACPNWNVLGHHDSSNAPSSNLGCANTTNLYLMVADPNDLLGGRALTPADAEPGMRAVQAYRTGNQSVNPQLPSLGASITAIGGGSTGGSGGGSGGQ